MNREKLMVKNDKPKFVISKIKTGYKIGVAGGAGLCATSDLAKARLLKKLFELCWQGLIMRELVEMGFSRGQEKGR
jgi:hypothetical protein